MINNNNEIKISVRNLVEFILRSGDIDNRRGGVSDKEAMEAGSKLHRKLQKRMGPEYHSEYPLKIIVPRDNYTLTIEGRADGIIISEEEVTIDEIKGMYKDLKYLLEPVGVHLAQAMCYGYIYGKENKLERIKIQMTYCNLDTEELKYFTEEYTMTFLKNWFDDLIEKYLKWAQFLYDWRGKRQESIKDAQFPFPYREGQRGLAATVYKTVLNNKKLFIQAPTGVGKTMSTVFPAVKAVGEGLSDKIFYLTAKTITRTVAKEAFDILKSRGLQYKVVTITAKEKLCLQEEMECNPVACPYAKGHYDRVNGAVFEIINKEDDFTRDIIHEYAKHHQVCPFEFCLDICNWVDGIICDYNYVFDPNVYLRRFFAEGVKGNYIFLIDEAHNLVDRGREMYSASLYKEDFLEIKNLIKSKRPKLEKMLSRCNKNLLELKRECDNFSLLTTIGHFILSLLSLTNEIEKYLEEEEDSIYRKKVLEFYLEVRNFLNIHDRLDDNYVIYSEHENDGRFKLKLFCVNPSKNLKGFLDKGDAAIFFSATLLPVNYYKELLSEPEDYAVYADSPFNKENRLLLLAKDVSSKYTRRNTSEYEKIAEYIMKTVKRKNGNYFVFFPSYRFMEDVYIQFKEKCDSLESHEFFIQSIKQNSYMSEKEREEFLNCFSNNDENIESLEGPLVGFCVLGGIFSEGIDLKNDQLIGAIIVGTGLPQICNEREILKNYYEEKHKNGFDFAYRYPGMNKILQAAGRVIRTNEDRGVILLLDDRFMESQYKNLFPREWDEYTTCTLETVESEIDEFWENDLVI